MVVGKKTVGKKQKTTKIIIRGKSEYIKGKKQNLYMGSIYLRG